MSFSNKDFKKLSLLLGMKFISVTYNPLFSYLKSIKKDDLIAKRDFLKFLYDFKENTQSRVFLTLSQFKTNSTFFNSVLIATCDLVQKSLNVYGSRVFDVVILILDKLIDKYYKFNK